MFYAGKRHIGILCLSACLLILLFTACGNNQGFSQVVTSAPTPAAQGTPKADYGQQVFRIPIVGADLDIKTYDPALVTDSSSNKVLSMNFNGLVRFDDNLQIQPELADSWKQSPDGLQWSFHLRTGLTFSDGAPLTSSDVAYSIDRSLQKSIASPAALEYLNLIVDADKLQAGTISTIIGSSILTPDANTVIFKLVKKAAYFLYTLTYPTAYVVEKRLITKYGNQKFVEHLAEGGGAGPFILSRHINQQEIDFVPNPYYYGLKPTCQKVSFLFYKTSDEAYSAYQTGQVDIVGVPPDRYDDAHQYGAELSQTPRLLTTYIAMNFLAKPFDNLYIRQALALAINRETINKTIYKGNLIITYHIIPQGMIGYRAVGLTGPANVQDARGNAAVAKQLLQAGLREEGWSDVSQMPPIRFSYQKDPVIDKMVSMIMNMWQSVLGITVARAPITFNELLDSLNKTTNNANGLQIWLAGWISDYPDPQDWTSINFGKGEVNNYMNYGQNTSADAIQEQVVQQQLAQADAEQDESRRIALYQSAEEQLVNQVAWLPLLQSRSVVLLKPYVQGYQFNAQGIIPPTDWANIYIARH